MKLEKWLELQKIQVHIFARRIGKTRSLVHKYLHEGVIPKKKAMAAIYIETLGSVSANDFYGLSEQIFDQLLAKSTLTEKLNTNSFNY